MCAGVLEELQAEGKGDVEEVVDTVGDKRKKDSADDGGRSDGHPVFPGSSVSNARDGAGSTSGTTGQPTRGAAGGGEQGAGSSDEDGDDVNTAAAGPEQEEET